MTNGQTFLRTTKYRNLWKGYDRWNYETTRLIKEDGLHGMCVYACAPIILHTESVARENGEYFMVSY